MTSFNLNKTKVNQKDIEKGQKIVAAIYLITDHLPESEPIRQSLRSLVIHFVQTSHSEQRSVFSQIEILLGAASLSGLISEKNSSIVIYEARRFCEESHTLDTTGQLSDLFVSNQTSEPQASLTIKDIKRTMSFNTNRQISNVSDMSNTKSLMSKSSRQDKILSFINDRKSAVIKDITSLFPEVSEKTIQRELNTLIDTGRITKRGSKRWSMYMAVNSLL